MFQSVVQYLRAARTLSIAGRAKIAVAVAAAEKKDNADNDDDDDLPGKVKRPTLKGINVGELVMSDDARAAVAELVDLVNTLMRRRFSVPNTDLTTLPYRLTAANSAVTSINYLFRAVIVFQANYKHQNTRNAAKRKDSNGDDDDDGGDMADADGGDEEEEEGAGGGRAIDNIDNASYAACLQIHCLLRAKELESSKDPSSYIRRCTLTYYFSLIQQFAFTQQNKYNSWRSSDSEVIITESTQCR